MKKSFSLSLDRPHLKEREREETTRKPVRYISFSQIFINKPILCSTTIYYVVVLV